MAQSHLSDQHGYRKFDLLIQYAVAFANERVALPEIWGHSPAHLQGVPPVRGATKRPLAKILLLS
ncbi:MAG: hypothetical protein WC177_06590, partial [Bacilli bacterium]